MSTAHLENHASTHGDVSTAPARPTLHAVVPDGGTTTVAEVHDLAAARQDHEGRLALRDDRLVEGQRRRLDVRARGLGQLLERRPELRGAHAPADLALEALYAGI